MSTTLTTAREFHAAGLSTVAARADGTKAPYGAWARYQTERMSVEDLEKLFTNSPLGIGFITGKISNNIFLIELEGRAIHHIADLTALAEASGLQNLWHRINTGWLELSPSGGIHWHVRVENPTDIPRNTKLARDNQNITLAEIKGEGGFVVTAPSSGTVHPTGKPWTRIAGGPTTVPTLTPAELEAIKTLLSTLDTTPEQQPTPSGPISNLWATYKPSDGDITPGDDYENKTDWTDILHDWTHIFTRGTTRYWRRPGKTDGISATTGHAGDRDRLYVFTSSTQFTPETPYTKFGAYTLLNHAGDHTKAAKQLANDGYGHRAPRPLNPPKQRHLAAVTPITGTQTADGTTPPPKPLFIESDDHALTETGNAKLLADQHQHKLTYIPETGRWATWTGTRWEITPDDAPAIQAALDIAERLPTDNTQIKNHRKRSLATRSLTNVARLAKTLPELRTPANKFDTHPWQLNTPNGIVNLKTGEITPNQPTQYHTKQTTTHADLDQTPHQWHKFLQTTFADPQLIEYIQKLAGLSLIGETLEHVLPFLHGQGANGKSTFVETITGILGDYATEAPHGFLLTGRDKHETELAALQGRRFVAVSEVNENTKFDEAKIKALTGGDKITARFMRQDFFTFTPTHTLWLMGNHQPKVESGGESLWRRLRLIPFTQIIPEKDRIENLQQKLIQEEGPAILAWLIVGAVKYHQNGLQEPETVKAATNTYRQEEDHLSRFIEDRCIIGGGDHARLDTAELRRAYDQWCRDENEHELNGTAFGRQLRQKYDIGSIRTKGRKFYTGIMLQNHEPEETNSSGSSLFGTHWSDK